MSAQRPHIIGDYEITTVSLGTGQYAVKLGIHVPTGEKVAVKIMEKYRLSSVEEKEAIVKETKALKKLKHENIIQLYEVYDEKSAIYLFMELAQGGDMFDHVTRRGKLSEKDSARFFYQIIRALEFCHENSVVHRDLKPENILLDELHERIMISDFGFCDHVGNGSCLTDYCGSHCYAAPEVLLREENYDGNKADIWSLGVILFYFLSGNHPFEGEQLQTMLLQIVSGKRKSIPEEFSYEAKDILSKLLTFEPSKRPSLGTLLEHAWLRNNRTSSALSPCSDSPQAGVERVKKIQLSGSSFTEEEEQRQDRPKLLPAENSNKNVLLNLMNEPEYKPLDNYSLSDSKINSGSFDSRIEDSPAMNQRPENRVYVRRGASPSRTASSPEIIISENQRGRKNVSRADSEEMDESRDFRNPLDGKEYKKGETSLFFRERKKFSFMDPREAHEHVIDNIMPSMNFSREEVLESIRKNDHNPASATYHLLMRKMSRFSDASDISGSFSATHSPEHEKMCNTLSATNAHLPRTFQRSFSCGNAVVDGSGNSPPSERAGPSQSHINAEPRQLADDGTKSTPSSPLLKGYSSITCGFESINIAEAKDT